jgi:AcrR family transcriptional regulator
MRPKKFSDKDILDVVRTCIIEQGATVSTQYIADQLGVSQATLFKRFGSKSNMLKTATLLPSTAGKAREMMERLKAGPTDEPVRFQMERMCLQMLRFYDEVLPCFASLHASGLRFDSPLPDDAPPILARKNLTRWVAILQEQGRVRSDVHPESIALTLIGTMQHRPFRVHLIRDNQLTQTDEEYVASIVEVLWHGLATDVPLKKSQENP